MGQAKRRRDAGERVSWCRTCTLCCVLPEINALDKPIYRACSHIANKGCGIFGVSARPMACETYACAYHTARLTDAPDRNHIPHPSEAGAYLHRDPMEKIIALSSILPNLSNGSAVPFLGFYERPLRGRNPSLFSTVAGR